MRDRFPIKKYKDRNKKGWGEKEVGIRPLVGTLGEGRQKEVKLEQTDQSHCPEVCPTGQLVLRGPQGRCMV